MAGEDRRKKILQLLKDKDADGVAKFIAEKHWVPIYTDNDVIL